MYNRTVNINYNNTNFFTYFNYIIFIFEIAFYECKSILYLPTVSTSKLLALYYT